MGLTGLKSRCRQGRVPSGGRGRESVAWPLAASGSLCSLARGPLHLQGRHLSIFKALSDSDPPGSLFHL